MAAPSSAMVSAPVAEAPAATTQTSRSRGAEGRRWATSAATQNTAEPIMTPTLTIVASNRLSVRRSCVTRRRDSTASFARLADSEDVTVRMAQVHLAYEPRCIRRRPCHFDPIGKALLMHRFYIVDHDVQPRALVGGLVAVGTERPRDATAAAPA